MRCASFVYMDAMVSVTERSDDETFFECETPASERSVDMDEVHRGSCGSRAAATRSLRTLWSGERKMVLVGGTGWLGKAVGACIGSGVEGSCVSPMNFQLSSAI